MGWSAALVHQHAAGARAARAGAGRRRQRPALARRQAGAADFHPLAPAVLEIHRRLKTRFDPHGIFNPGRLVAHL
jgi:glycolate oxidase FAD binding subunit